MPRNFLASIDAEYHRYKALAEGAISQVADSALGTTDGASENSITTIVWHLSGNLQSRFTDFLTTDGEKPWRLREEEFAARAVPRDELVQTWEAGWATLFAALASLTDADLTRSVAIRGVALQVHEALHRSLAHVSYHVGQIVLLAKHHAGSSWTWLSIPPGGSASYNQNPTLEKPAAHDAAIRSRKG